MMLASSRRRRGGRCGRPIATAGVVLLTVLVVVWAAGGARAEDGGGGVGGDSSSSASSSSSSSPRMVTPKDLPTVVHPGEKGEELLKITNDRGDNNTATATAGDTKSAKFTTADQWLKDMRPPPFTPAPSEQMGPSDRACADAGGICRDVTECHHKRLIKKKCGGPDTRQCCLGGFSVPPAPSLPSLPEPPVPASILNMTLRVPPPMPLTAKQQVAAAPVANKKSTTTTTTTATPSLVETKAEKQPSVDVFKQRRLEKEAKLAEDPWRFVEVGDTVRDARIRRKRFFRRFVRRVKRVYHAVRRVVRHVVRRVVHAVRRVFRRRRTVPRAAPPRQTVNVPKHDAPFRKHDPPSVRHQWKPWPCCRICPQKGDGGGFPDIDQIHGLVTDEKDYLAPGMPAGSKTVRVDEHGDPLARAPTDQPTDEQQEHARNMQANAPLMAKQPRGGPSFLEMVSLNRVESMKRDVLQSRAYRRRASEEGSKDVNDVDHWGCCNICPAMGSTESTFLFIAMRAYVRDGRVYQASAAKQHQQQQQHASEEAGQYPAMDFTAMSRPATAREIGLPPCCNFCKEKYFKRNPYEDEVGLPSTIEPAPATDKTPDTSTSLLQTSATSGVGARQEAEDGRRPRHRHHGRQVSHHEDAGLQLHERAEDPAMQAAYDSEMTDAEREAMERQMQAQGPDAHERFDDIMSPYGQDARFRRRRFFRRVGRFFRRVGRAVKRVARRVGRFFRRAARRVGRFFRRVGRRVGRFFRRTGRFFRRVGRAVVKHVPRVVRRVVTKVFHTVKHVVKHVGGAIRNVYRRARRFVKRVAAAFAGFKKAPIPPPPLQPDPPLNPPAPPKACCHRCPRHCAEKNRRHRFYWPEGWQQDDLPQDAPGPLGKQQ